MKTKKFLTAFVTVFFIIGAYGCVSTKELNARLAPLEDRVSKLEQAQQAGTVSLDADVKKAEDAAARAETAAKRSEDAAVKAESSQKAAETAEKNAETAEKKAEKEFQLMQKK